MASPAKCRYCHREYGTARYISIDAVRDRMVCDDCKAQRETASSDGLAVRLMARVDRALAQVRSMKAAVPARPTPTPAPPISKSPTDVDRAADFLKFF